MRILRTSLTVAALVIGAHSAAFAQAITCPPGQTLVSVGGQNFCVVLGNPVGAPEISTSASSGGIVLLAGSILLLRGRRRRNVSQVPA